MHRGDIIGCPYAIKTQRKARNMRKAHSRGLWVPSWFFMAAIPWIWPWHRVENSLQSTAKLNVRKIKIVDVARFTYKGLRILFLI